MNVTGKAEKAQKASRKLAKMSEEERRHQMEKIIDVLQKNQEEILEANKRDVEKAEEKRQNGKYSQVLVDRLRLDGKIESLVEMVQKVEQKDKVVNKSQEARKLTEELELCKVSTPLGVVATIFESRPDALVQISALCMKSGNSVILKGGSEAENSNRKLYYLIKEATDVDGWIQLVEEHKEVDELLELENKIDLIIPRGSKSLVEHIQENTAIEVMGHAEGLCHIYVDSGAEKRKTVDIAVDAKTDYPAACNAAETLLVHEESSDMISDIVEKLREKNVEFRGCKRTTDMLDIEKADIEDWETEYNDLKISIKLVESLEEAVSHINRFGSGHTDSIVTEDKEQANRFLQSVDSSSVMWNVSTRFADGFRYGLGAEVGISTGKTHARGPVGVEGLTTYKYILRGSGNQVSKTEDQDYTHRDI